MTEVTKEDVLKREREIYFSEYFLKTSRKVSQKDITNDTIVTYTVRDESGATVPRKDLASQLPDEWLKKLKV